MGGSFSPNSHPPPPLSFGSFRFFLFHLPSTSPASYRLSCTLFPFVLFVLFCHWVLHLSIAVQPGLFWRVPPMIRSLPRPPSFRTSFTVSEGCLSVFYCVLR